MTQPEPEPTNAPKATRTARHETRTNNPRLRTIHDLRFRDVFVVDSKPTR
jgi:hypothetical protein